MKLEKYILTSIILVVVSLFVFTIFKNLSYPLMWGDETETAMFAKSILRYGYPKVHLGVNEVNFLPTTEEGVGIIKKYDAYVGLPWLQYYVGAIGEYFAQNTSDIFLKTLFMRLPFALLGFLGVILFPLVVAGLLKQKKPFYFLILFYLLMLVSVPLQLHIREARSYSVTIFFYSLGINVFILYYILKKIPYYLYVLLMSPILFLIFFNFVPSYPPILLTVLTYPPLDFLVLRYLRFYINKKDYFAEYIKTILPAIISLMFATPTAIIFQMNKVSSGVWQLIGFNISIYFSYLVRALTFFIKYDYLVLYLFVKILIAIYVIKKRKLLIQKFNSGETNLFKMIKVLFFLTLLFIVYLLLVCITPYIFDRYYIVLQMVLGMDIILGIFTYIGFLSLKDNELKTRHKNKEVFIFATILIFFISIAIKNEIIQGRIYELNNRYVGPLDYSISYLSKEENIKDKTIEAWHEQTSYMYYLGSRIIYNYYEKDPEYLEFPDVFITSTYMVPDYYNKKLDTIIKSRIYKKVVFPIRDYPANNIPELSISLRHLFKTGSGKDPNNLTIYIKHEN